MNSSNRNVLTLEDLIGPEVPPFLTVNQVAKILQINSSTVRRGCERKKYERAFKIGKDWRIPSRCLEKQIRDAELTGEFAA